MSDTFDDTTLYTNKRLNNFVKNYQDFNEKIVNRGFGDSQQNRYKYYRFEYSPEGIFKTDIGRIPSELLKSVNAWKLKTTDIMNSPNGWLMDIASDWCKIKQTEFERINAKAKSNPTYVSHGLKYTIIKNLVWDIPQPSETTINTFLTATPKFINLFHNDINLDPTNNPPRISGEVNSKMDSFNNTFSSIYPNNLENNLSSAFGCEWVGYFKPTLLGSYKFKINVGQGYCLMWIDDKSICEYISSNADIQDQTNTFTANIKEDRYYPIRIQYFVGGFNTISFNQRIFAMTIMNEDTQTSVFPDECFYIIDSGNYIPPILYCAFVSTSIDKFVQSEFNCYICNTHLSSQSESRDFLKLINREKFNIFSRKYDRDDNGDIIEWGTLIDGVNYTPVSSTPSSLPERFSIYRIDADTRMGKSFQINLDGVNKNKLAPFVMNELSDDLIKKSNTYYQLNQYYPEYPEQSTDVSPEVCKDTCNQNSNCNYYFTYLSNNTPKCLIGTNNKLPTFTQIRPNGGTTNTSADEKTSTLFLRNYEILPPVCDVNQVSQKQPVVNINTYNQSFPYATYKWDKTKITDISFVGSCGDTEYLDQKRIQTEGAYDILFKNSIYHKDGSFDKFESFDNIGKDNMKNTDAITDTEDIVRAGIKNQEKYAKLQEEINTKYVQLSNYKIPEYLATKKVMENNVDYDFSGNILLNFLNKHIPTVREQHLLDLNQEHTSQNLLYILGTLTAATLLILAIIIGKE